MILLHLHAMWRRAFNLPAMRHPCRVWLRAFLAVACAFSALLAARAQETNPPSLQYSPTPILSQAVETNQPPPLPPPIVETAPAQTAPSYPFIETNQPGD